ncbi:hypothetical protein [Gemelliphila palaticanis]|nr:hypothetical protein [Gemella palaticanis]
MIIIALILIFLFIVLLLILKTLYNINSRLEDIKKNIEQKQ